MRSGAGKNAFACLQAAFIFFQCFSVSAAAEQSYNAEALREMVTGYELFQNEQTTEAAEHLERALKLDRKSDLLRSVYAEALFELKKYDKARELLEPQVERPGEVDSRVIKILAYSCQAVGKNKEAIEYLKRLVKQDPWDEWDRRRLLELLKNEGRYQELIAYYKPLLDPESDTYALDLFQLGALYLRIGGHEPARDYLQKALEVDSTQADVYELLGNLDESERRWNEALQNYLDFMEHKPDEAVEVFGRILAVAQRTISRAEGGKAEGADTVAGDSTAWVGFLGRLEAKRANGDSLGLTQMRVMAIGSEAIGRYAEAIEINRRIAASDPRDAFSRRSLLRLLFEQKKYAEMIPVYEEVLNPADESYTHDLIQLSALYLKNQNREAARKDLETALQIDSTLAEAHQLLGHILELDGDPKGALAHYLAQVRLEPAALRGQFERLLNVAIQAEQPAAPLNLLEYLAAQGDTSAWSAEQLGRLYYYNGKRDEALKLLEPLKARGILSENGFYVLGYLYAQHQAYDKAVEAFLRVKKAQPDYIPVYEVLGSVLYSKKDYLGSKSVLEDGLQRVKPEDNQNRLDLMFSLGNVSHELKDDQGCEAWMKKVLDLEPDYAPALNYLGYLYAERGDNLEQAEGMIERALKAEPGNGHYLDSMGWVLFKLGRLEAALDYTKTSLANLGAHPEVYEHLGEIYLALGKRDLAREAWSKSLEMDHANAELAKKLKELTGNRK